MNIRMLALLLALLWALPAAAQVNAIPSAPHLLVKGSANRDVVPDRFTVAVALSATDMRPELARERVQRNLATLIGSLKGSRVVPGSIDTTVFSVGPHHEYENEMRVFKGTRATRQLRATFPDADSTRAFLSGLQADEDVQLSGITPAYSGEDALRAELKAEAMRRTRETGELLAKAYGTRIRGLYSVSDVAPSFAYGVQAGQWPSADRRVAGVPAPPEEPPVVFDEPSALDSVTVTGSRITPESIEVGTINLSEHLYAIFLLAE